MGNPRKSVEICVLSFLDTDLHGFTRMDAENADLGIRRIPLHLPSYTYYSGLRIRRGDFRCL